MVFCSKKPAMSASVTVTGTVAVAVAGGSPPALAFLLDVDCSSPLALAGDDAFLLVNVVVLPLLLF